jgi:hypothetical protein
MNMKECDGLCRKLDVNEAWYIDAAPRDQECSMFSGRHFVRSVILLCVQLAWNLSFPDLEEMMAERGMRVDHSTFHRWAVRFLPLLLKRFTRRKRMVTGRRWTPMMGKGQARYTFTPVPSLAEQFEILAAWTVPSPSQLSSRRVCDRIGAPAYPLSCFGASPAREKAVHYCVRNALGTTIVKLIDATEGGTELAYKHFNQQISGVVETCLYDLRCECKQLGKVLRRHAVDYAGHQHDAQIIGLSTVPRMSRKTSSAI